MGTGDNIGNRVWRRRDISRCRHYSKQRKGERGSEFCGLVYSGKCIQLLESKIQYEIEKERKEESKSQESTTGIGVKSIVTSDIKRSWIPSSSCFRGRS